MNNKKFDYTILKLIYIVFLIYKITNYGKLKKNNKIKNIY